jgi:ribose transport system substrate-binding protein
MSVSVFKQIGGKGKVINLSGIPGNWSNDTRVMGVDLALKEFPDIELVARLNGGENRVAAAPIIENLLTAHPDVKAVVCHNDDSAIAVLNALRERGMKHVKVGGVDAINEFLDAMQKGPNAAASTAIHGGWLGGYATVSLFDALNGVKLNPVERMVDQDSLVIDTPEAAKAYQELIYRPKKLPFDWKGASRFLNPETWNTQNGVLPINLFKYFWTEVVPDTQPKGWKLPKVYQDAIDAGDIEKYSKIYKAHSKGGPIGEVIALTTSKKTVLGFG